MATQSKLPLSVILGLVDKLTDPWKRVDAKVRMQVRNLGQLGQSWTNNLTNPLRTFGSFAVQQAAVWDDLQRKLHAFRGIGAADATRGLAQIRQFATSAGVAVNDLADVVDGARQEFTTMQDIVAATNASAGLSRIVPRTSPLQAFEMIARVHNAFPKTPISEIQDVLSRAGQAGKANELVEQIFKVSKAARGMRLSLTQSAAAFIAFLEEGRAARESGRLLGNFAVSTERIRKGTELLNAQRPFESLLRDLGGGLIGQLTRLNNALDELGKQVGDSGLLAGLKTLIEFAASGVRWFSSWPGWIRATLVWVGALTAAIGPLLLLVVKVGQSILIWQQLEKVLPILTSVRGGIAGLFRASPWLIAIGFLIDGITDIATHWDDFVKNVKGFFTWLNSRADWLVPDSWTQPLSASELQPMKHTLMETLRNRSDITVKFKGAPPGTSVESKGDARITTDLGISPMHHVAGAH